MIKAHNIIMCVCLSLLIGSPATIGAPIIILIDGKVIDAAPNEPQQPTSEVECANYFERATETLNFIQQAHDKCLSDDSNESDTGVTGTENTCSKSACQQLHSVRSEMLERITKANTACKSKVVEYSHNQPPTSQLIFSNIFSTIMDELESIVKSGAAEVISTEEVTIGSTDELIIDRIIEKCKKLITLDDQEQCLNTISSWSTSALSMASKNAIAEKIQNTSMQRIIDKNSETLNHITHLKKSINQLESKDGKSF